jgi:hypothetical protein
LNSDIFASTDRASWNALKEIEPVLVAEGFVLEKLIVCEKAVFVRFNTPPVIAPVAPIFVALERLLAPILMPDCAGLAMDPLNALSDIYSVIKEYFIFTDYNAIFKSGLPSRLQDSSKL